MIIILVCQLLRSGKLYEKITHVSPVDMWESKSHVKSSAMNQLPSQSPQNNCKYYSFKVLYCSSWKIWYTYPYIHIYISPVLHNWQYTYQLKWCSFTCNFIININQKFATTRNAILYLNGPRKVFSDNKYTATHSCIKEHQICIKIQLCEWT